MSLISILSLTLFFVFFVSYLLKLFMLYWRNGIKANVLAKGGKSKEIGYVEIFVKITTFVWGALWFVFSIFDLKTGYFIGLSKQFVFIRYIGVFLITIGVFLFIIAMVSMKTSWRVGIDKKTKSSLVADGIYRYSRNPAFVGFDAMFIGFTLTYPGLLTLLVTVLNALAIHRLILQEEMHLYSVFGEEYSIYKSKTPRYIFF